MPWFIGLDLGQACDRSALVVLEQTVAKRPRHFAVRHLERFPQGTPYPKVVERLYKPTREKPRP